METLPDEIYEIICGRLPVRDLETAMLVDRYSRFIIENSPVLMENLPLFITDCHDDEFGDNENGKLIEPLLSSRRKVIKVVVKLKREKIMKYLAIFKKFGETIRFLEIRNYAFETIDQMRIILRYVPNLQSLKISHVTFEKPENKILNTIVQIPKLSLKQLRDLDCADTDPKIFSLFTNNRDIQLRTIRLGASDAQSFQYRDFIETLSQQTRLRVLSLDKLTSENSDIFDSSDWLRCQLDVLEVKNCAIGQREQMRNLIQVVKDQKKLKVLKLINTAIPTSMDMIFAYRQIFANCVSKAHVDIGNLSFFHRHHFANRTVRDLTLHGNFAFENLPIFINFIKIFPNVVCLKLVGELPINDKYLFSILTTFKNLTELHVPGFTSRTADSNFSNLSSIDSKLETLVLDYIDYDVKYFGWKNIVTNLRFIDKLVIKRDYGKVSNEILDVIVKKLKLKHLELGIGVVTKEILRNIVYNNSVCSDQLKVLKVPKSDLSKIEHEFDFRPVFARNRLLLYQCEDEYFYVRGNEGK